MHTITVLGGDVQPGMWVVETSGWIDKSIKGFATGIINRASIDASEVASISAVDEETTAKGGVGRAVVGGLMFGGAGAIVGAATRGTSRTVTFECVLRDGRRFLARTTGEVWAMLQPIAYSAQRAPIEHAPEPEPEWVSRAVQRVEAPAPAPVSAGRTFGKRR